MTPLRWTTKSTRALAAELAAQGHRVSADTVGGLLRREGFSLQGNVKTVEGKQHPDRDAQFRYISEQVKAHQGTADPVISVDANKKELVGAGRATPAASGGPRAALRPRSSMTSPRTPSARPCPTASTTSPRTPAG
jgi:Rhodopirellula transposase DDE domain